MDSVGEGNLLKRGKEKGCFVKKKKEAVRYLKWSKLHKDVAPRITTQTTTTTTRTPAISTDSVRQNHVIRYIIEIIDCDNTHV